MENTDIILNSLGGISYGGVFLVALAANFVIPVPEEIILLVIGYLTSVGVFMYPVAMALFILGMLVSDYVLYSLSFHGSRFVDKLREKMIKRGFLKNENYMRKNIKKIVFFSRFLVYLRFIGPVMSGSLKIKRKVFLTYDFLALVLYVNLFLALGNLFHRQIYIITNGVAHFINYFLTAIIILGTLALMRFLHKHFVRWFYKISEYIATIVPGLEQEIDTLDKKEE